MSGEWPVLDPKSGRGIAFSISADIWILSVSNARYRPERPVGSNGGPVESNAVQQQILVVTKMGLAVKT